MRQVRRLYTLILTKGFNIGVRGTHAYVICDRKEKKALEAQPGRTEWVTIVECICADGGAIQPLIIFKGENFQTGWIPNDMNTTWNWSCNTKGWTCDKIAKAWIKKVFEPVTRAKVTNGEKRVLICDGHGSHVSADFVRYCLDAGIILLLMPPHSSHLCQPLDVGVFSPLKEYMSQELNETLKYGVPNIKKYEWADAYQRARPKAMSANNVTSAFRATGLVPFNRRKVLVRMPTFQEKDCDSDLELESNEDITTESQQEHPFANVPATPSRIDPTILKDANAALLSNIQAGIFDTPTRTFIPKLATFAEFSSTQVVIANHKNQAKDSIIKRRREVTTGKRVCLKDQCIITTEELYAKLQRCEQTTAEKKASKGHRRVDSALATLRDIATNEEESEQA